MPEVMKTLVIGLGSTGTEICDSLHRRLQWQYGNVDNVPWVKFLCIETDTNQRTSLRKDFTTIKIDAESLRDYRMSSHQHVERLQLKKWFDEAAFEDFKPDSVVGGAGNIRSIGRLALFHNYSEIKTNISDRLSKLKGLSLTDARDSDLWKDVTFAAEGAVRVFVVGGLTGGTCSGTICDVGFILKRLVSLDGDRVYAMLGFPNPMLGESDHPNAERWKKNAWHALTELETYCGPGRKFPPFRFPGDFEVTDEDAPFDAVFIFQPGGTDVARGVERLNGQISEGVYLNIFAPQVDVWSERADMPRHRFCSQGLAVIEFPAERVGEACSKRLVAASLDQWLSSAGEERINSSIAVNWEWLVKACSTTEAGDDLLAQVNRDVRSITDALNKLSVKDAEDAISRIAASFQSGAVRENAKLRIMALPRILQTKLEESVSRHLKEIDYGGPHNFVAALRRISKFLAELENSQPSEARNDIHGLLSKLRRIKQSTLLRFMGLQKLAARPVIAQIVSSVRGTYGEDEIRRVILDCVRTSGVVKDCEGVVVRFIQRMEGLQSRVRDAQETLDKEWRNLAAEDPSICGFSLFDKAKDPSQDGSVNVEYQSCLADRDSSQAKQWRNGERLAMQEVIRALGPVEDLFRDRNRNLLDTNQRAEGEPSLPENVLNPMLDKAAESFAKVRTVDVLKRWKHTEAAASKAEDLFALSVPSVRVDPSRATRGGMPLPRPKRYLLLPPGDSDDFKRVVEHKLRDYKIAESPNHHTIACLQQHVALDLSAVLSAVGVNGLHRAQCGEFRVWHTRKDVKWVRPEVELSPEVEKLRSMIVVGVLLGVLHIRDRNLQLVVEDALHGEKTLKLPWHTQEAALRVRAGSQDLEGQSLAEFEGTLEERLRARRREVGTDELYRQLIDAFRKKVGDQIPDRTVFARLLMSFCKADVELEAAMKRINRPTSEARAELWKEEGAELPGTKQPAPAKGFYCRCSALIGHSESEAEETLWTCPVCSTYFGLSV